MKSIFIIFLSVFLSITFWFFSFKKTEVINGSEYKSNINLDISLQNLQVRILRGQKIFEDKCSSCHGKDGAGVLGVFPPLANSDWLKKGVKIQAISSVKNGKSGQIEVNGISYNGVMPAQSLSDGEIADVLTYVFNSWGNDKTVVTEQDVKSVTKNTFTGMKKSDAP